MIYLLNLLVLATVTFVNKVSAQTVTFDCNAIPETCNNMCFASARLVYFQMHYDPNTGNRPGRRTAAGCLPNPNRCNSNPPGPGLSTCDEYPFASTYGTGTGGWYSGTGATTRCVSPTECSSQGGSLSAFYQSFGGVDQTPISVVVAGYSATVAPYCANAGMASDGLFATGAAPPNRRRDVPSQKPIRGLYEYKTSNNRTVLSLGGPLSTGTKIFIPNPDWQSNPKVSQTLSKRQGDAPNDDCLGTGAQIAAASQLSNQELGQTDTIGQSLGTR